MLMQQCLRDSSYIDREVDVGTVRHASLMPENAHGQNMPRARQNSSSHRSLLADGVSVILW